MITSGLSLVACQPSQLPNGVVLELSPSDKTITIEAPDESGNNPCLAFGYPYIDVPFVFALRDAQGTPIGNVPVNFYADWTAQSSGLQSGLLLMHDFNGDGVTDPETESVSQLNDAVYMQHTKLYSGDVHLTLRLNLSCPYRGELVAFSGGYHTSASFAVESSGESPRPAIDNEPEPETELLKSSAQ